MKILLKIVPSKMFFSRSFHWLSLIWLNSKFNALIKSLIEEKEEPIAVTYNPGEEPGELAMRILHIFRLVAELNGAEAYKLYLSTFYTRQGNEIAVEAVANFLISTGRLDSISN